MSALRWLASVTLAVPIMLYADAGSVSVHERAMAVMAAQSSGVQMPYGLRHVDGRSDGDDRFLGVLLGANGGGCLWQDQMPRREVIRCAADARSFADLIASVRRHEPVATEAWNDASVKDAELFARHKVGVMFSQVSEVNVTEQGASVRLNFSGQHCVMDLKRKTGSVGGWLVSSLDCKE